MGIRFASPAALLGLILPVIAYLLSRANPWHLPRRRQRTILALRLTLLTALILALAGAELQWTVRSETVMFVVDRSASLSAAGQTIDDWLKEALAERPESDPAGIVTVGTEAMVELLPSRQPSFRSVEGAVDENHTNLAGGLRLAAGLFPDDTRRRIVLISDGQENIGQALTEAQKLAAQGVRIDVLPLTTASGPDVLVRSLTAPGVLHAGESFALTVVVESTIAGQGTLRIYGDRAQIGEQTVTLRPGINRFHVTARVGAAGFHGYRATIDADDDTRSQNNQASTFVRVLGQPRVLIVEGKAGAGGNLARALAARDLDVSTIRPGEMPQSLSELRQYATVVLCDVPATDLTDSVMTQLEVAVRDLGLGLVMTGGEDSFGPGGYFRTPIERALPVNMDLRGKGELPSLGLVLVVDKSGSMSEGAWGVTKVDLAKEAAMRATEVLTAQDRIGVLAFDDAAKWAVELQSPEDLGVIQDAIGTIRADGGTDIYPALELAYRALKDSPTKLRHIILLTDGMSNAGGGYPALLEQMKAAGISLSTVAVGSDADQNLLSYLAQAGNGRYYATAEYSTIPKIFSKEAILASRNYLVDRTFVPAVGTASALLRGVTEAGVPSLDGYVATSQKAAAEQVLLSDNGDPVLIAWQYGLGRSVAWTPDLSGRWTGRWVGWEGFARLLANAVDWTLPATDPAAADATLTSEAGIGRIVYELSELPAEETTLTATVVNPDLTTLEAPLTAVAPGRYEASFDAAMPGLYLTTITEAGADGRVRARMATGLAVPYSPEYLPASGGSDLLTAIAAATGGKVLTDPAGAFADHAPPVRAHLPLWPGLLTLAAILLPLDIASRRLFFTADDLRHALSRLRGRSQSGLALADTVLSGVATQQLARREARRRLAAKRPASPSPTPQPLPARPAQPLPAQPTPGQVQPAAGPATTSASGAPAVPTDTPRDDVYTERLLAAKRRRQRR